MVEKLESAPSGDPVAAIGQRTLKNDQDAIFRGEGGQLMLQLTKEAEGYMGPFDIRLQFA